jgi:N-acetylmuramoyl-L-alanine amidase-like protein
MQRRATRRSFVQMLAAAPLLMAATGGSAFAEAAAKSIARLIAESRTVPEAQASVSERMDFISRALLGVRYQANTLIGGPRRPERFVVRDDAFDCVTFCEFVLAAAIARDYGEFETVLRTIRYEHGKVVWAERNHYFAEWCRRAVENGICAPVAMPDAVTIDKTVQWGNQGRRQVSITGIPTKSLLANGELLANGDIIGFLSLRPNLDFFHTGLVIFEDDGALMLRSAALSRRRVVDEPMERFVAANNVQHVTLLRAVEKPAIAGGG